VHLALVALVCCTLVVSSHAARSTTLSRLRRADPAAAAAPTAAAPEAPAAAAASSPDLVHSGVLASINADSSKVAEMVRRLSPNGPQSILVLLEPARPNRFGADHETHLLSKDASGAVVNQLLTAAPADKAADDKSEKPAAEVALLESRASIHSAAAAAAQMYLKMAHAEQQQRSLMEQLAERFGAHAVSGSTSYWGINMLALPNVSNPEIVSFLESRVDVHGIEAADSEAGAQLVAQALQHQDSLAQLSTTTH